MITVPTRDEAHWLAERARDITSTRIACLYGVSPYQTPYSLWHEMRGTVTPERPDSRAMRLGRLYEPIIAAEAASEMNVAVVPMKDYYRHDEEARFGTSLDFAIPSHPDHDGPGLLEVKRVTHTTRGWEIGEDGTGEAPIHIELQVQHQMEVTAYNWCYIAAMFPGDRLVLIYRERDRLVGEQMRAKAREFLSLLEAPSPDYGRDLSTIAALNQYAEPGKLADWRVEAPDGALDLVQRYAELSALLSSTTKDRDAVKAALLTHVGDAEKVTTPQGTFTLGMRAEQYVPGYTRKAYRDFRFTPKRTKSDE